MGGLEKLTPFKHLVIFAVSMLDFSGINVSGPKSCFFLTNQREISESSPQVHQQRNVSFQEYLRTLEELALLCRVVFARSKQQMVIGEEYITTAFHSVNSGPRFFSSNGGRH